MLQRNLVLIRHGQSEANAFNNEVVNLTDREEFLSKPDWQRRLTQKGQDQARLTGEWIRQNFPPNYFDTGFVSAYVRARETAGLLGLGLDWKMSINLIERDSGLLHTFSEEEQIAEKAKAKKDPLFHRHGQGTGLSIADVISGSNHSMLDTLHREGSEKNVVAVCHGERMLSMHYCLTRMTPETLEQKVNSKDPLERIFNCQIMHYTRINPDDPSDIRDYPNWYRSCCPAYYKGEMLDTDWVEIKRKKFSDQELLQIVEQYPRYIN